MEYQFEGKFWSVSELILMIFVSIAFCARLRRIIKISSPISIILGILMCLFFIAIYFWGKKHTVVQIIIINDESITVKFPSKKEITLKWDQLYEASSYSLTGSQWELHSYYDEPIYMRLESFNLKDIKAINKLIKEILAKKGFTLTNGRFTKRYRKGSQDVEANF